MLARIASMKLFRCQVCDNIIYFENRTCGRCGHRLGYLPELGIMTALEPAGSESWTPWVEDSGPRRFCANADHDVCNWLTTAEGQDRLCVACRHNDTIPDISQAPHLTAWRDIELAKHRLFYSLLRWKLPLKTRAEDPSHGLMFEFLADPPHPSGPKVMTGHDDGVVTIALAEADSAEIERRRAELAEPYRSLLGHFRHEVGHHYRDILVRDGGKLEQCRAVFGDDKQDYEAALNRHYEQGAPSDGRKDSFQLTRPRIHGRISPKAGRITCISSTRSKRRTRSGLGSPQPSTGRARTSPSSTSTPTRTVRSNGLSTPGRRSSSP
jgi:hypothetical protein